MVDFHFDENLKKFWATNTTFRKIKVYIEPIESNKTKIITQKDILNKIASNINLALKDSDFRDLFITASTGLGKSLLFQLPAIDLHQNGLIVIVITPLKALMKDQVDSLRNKGINFATYMNSDDTYLEREEKLKGIKEGKYSLIYVSPELLVKHKNLVAMFNLKNERKIGLYVIDEAHCVSTWGKGFRPDYWFLGKRLEQWRKEKECNAPIVALTATAVNGGDFDSASEIIETLNLKVLPKEEVILSYVKRDNIEISISKLDQSYSEDKKKKFVIDKISELREKYSKILIYHPFKHDARRLSRELSSNSGIRAKPFVGDMDKEERDNVFNEFRDGRLDCIVATKAFGMGMDIEDIDCVYHYAINKSLTDYMQEIGRAGRKKEIKAYALTDFHPKKDLNYTKVLNKLSGISQWQIKEILKKIISIYKEYHQSERYKSVLIYPDTFFNFIEKKGDEEDIERKLELALLLLEKDLFQKFSDKILSFDIPETTEVFCYVPQREATRLKSTDYFKCFEQLRDESNGIIYKLNLEEFWRKFSRNKSLGYLKRNFFRSKLLGEIKIEPRIEIKANLKLNFEKAKSELDNTLQKIGDVVLSFDGSSFTSEKFADSFKELNFKDNFIADAILSFFSFEKNENLSKHETEYRFIQKYFGKYKIIRQGINRFYNFIKNNFSQLFSEQQSFHRYLSPNECDSKNKKLALGFLELLDLVDFQVKGSENIAFNIFIKDPIKIENLLAKGYFNQELDKFKKREDNELLLLKKFCNEYKTSGQAWEFLESYFLGRFEYSSTETTNSYPEDKNQADSFSESLSSEISTSEKTNLSSKEYSVGEKIVHKFFGYGIITKIYPDQADKAEADIVFDHYGKKRIDLNIAPIEKLSPTIEPGTLVEVEDLDTKEKILYHITEPNAPSSAIDGETTISPESLVGKDLVGHKKGDIITIQLHTGKSKTFKISDFCKN